MNHRRHVRNDNSSIDRLRKPFSRKWLLYCLEIIKKIKKAGTRLEEREEKNSRQGNWRNSRCVYARVRVIWNVAGDFAGTAPRIFLSLSACTVWFSPWKGKRNRHARTTNRRTLVSLESLPITRGLLHGFWHLEQARSAWQPVAEPATFSPLLLVSILIESKRHGHGFPSNQTRIYSFRRG